ncbi:nesprin-4 [Antechinus flavipes]|uniref:nesprin-4 n=1 Tax=Antechinus flavipes TaxID=38775 RepID=UPI0022368786|nr:nesprin-4 [Antechinus flavipes]
MSPELGVRFPGCCLRPGWGRGRERLGLPEETPPVLGEKGPGLSSEHRKQGSKWEAWVPRAGGGGPSEKCAGAPGRPPGTGARTPADSPLLPPLACPSPPGPSSTPGTFLLPAADAWTLAPAGSSRGPGLTRPLQAFLVNDQPAAEPVSGEGLMRRREPRSWATLEEGRPAPAAHCEGVRHRGRLIAYSLVFEDPAWIQDSDSDTDSEGPGAGPGDLGPRVGIGGERGGLPLEGPAADLEWDPTGDVGWLGTIRSRRVWTPGSPCEVCGHVEPLGAWSLRPWGAPRAVAPPDRKQPSPRDVTVQIHKEGEEPAGGAQPPRARRPLLFVLLLLLLGVACLLPPPRGPHCPPPRLPGPLHLVLSYVNGPPPT